MNLMARKLAHLLAENSNGSFFEDEIRYGLEIALGALWQIIIIALTALLLGIAKEVLSVALSAAVYRRYSGGPHCQTFYRCTLTSLVTFVGLGYISRNIPFSYLSFYIAFIAAFTVLIIHSRVPVDNPINPISDKQIIRKRKQKSYFMVFLVLLASIYTGYISEGKLVSIALLLGLLWQNFTLLPWGRSYIYLWDRLFDKVEKLFHGKEVTEC